MTNVKNEFTSGFFGYNPFDENTRKKKLNNTNTQELKEKYNLTDAQVDEYTTDILALNKNTYEELEEYIKTKGHIPYNMQEMQEAEDKSLFTTAQNNVVLPTKELIKQKNTDFRTLLGISAISNVDDITKVGNNNRYCSIGKVDRNMDKLCKSIGITPSQFRKHLRALLKHNTDEFKIIEKDYNGEKVLCYEINYVAGGFVNIPMSKVETLIIGLSNNCIKLYSNLLWLCTKDSEFIERELTQPYLLELMGLSKSSDKILKIATDTLEKVGLIKTRKVWESETILVDGMPQGSKPKRKIYYSIVV